MNRTICKLVAFIFLLMPLKVLSVENNINPDTLNTLRASILENPSSFKDLILQEFPEAKEYSHSEMVVFQMSLFNLLFATNEEQQDTSTANIAEKFDEDLQKALDKILPLVLIKIKKTQEQTTP